ncbi:G patch domain-containing protein 8-like isoform X3 [Stegodyphus dumicola]|uniref:G patch domain-containing protein 8-like isoform X3 n=1 Tax=Stegodyphus dumicola TaxID=202533 RepID=UPI0015AD083D|nr:G patch domain-containing protein 8-like isoform X3 [Stegodyphus dumicola]
MSSGVSQQRSEAKNCTRNVFSVLSKNIDTYDDGLLELEQSSMAQPISQDNLGYQLLQKQGWSSGKGLGRTEQVIS